MTIQHMDRNIDAIGLTNGALTIVASGAFAHLLSSALLHTVAARNPVINDCDGNQDGRPDDAECR